MAIKIKKKKRIWATEKKTSRTNFTYIKLKKKTFFLKGKLMKI